MCQASSPTKLAKIRAPAVGRSGEATYCWIPRPALYGDAVECSPPRSAVGINEYIYALSQRHPDAVRCANDRPSPPTRESPSRLRLPPAHTASRPSPSRRAGGRRGAAHWELTPSAAGLRVLTIKLRGLRQAEEEEGGRGSMRTQRALPDSVRVCVCATHAQIDMRAGAGGGTSGPQGQGEREGSSGSGPGDET